MKILKLCSQCKKYFTIFGMCIPCRRKPGLTPETRYRPKTRVCRDCGKKLIIRQPVCAVCRRNMTNYEKFLLLLDKEPDRYITKREDYWTEETRQRDLYRKKLISQLRADKVKLKYH